MLIDQRDEPSLRCWGGMLDRFVVFSGDRSSFGIDWTWLTIFLRSGTCHI